MSRAIVISLSLLYFCCHLVIANPDAKRLYDDLLKKKNYNKLMRPVKNHAHNLTVKINLKLSQLIDVVSILFDHLISMMFLLNRHAVFVPFSVTLTFDLFTRKPNQYVPGPCTCVA